MFANLWTEASRDITEENNLKAMEMAKHASQGVWAFLAQAQDSVEYHDRLELARDNIESVAAATGTPLEDLLEVFERRFALLMHAKDNPFGDDDSDSDNQDEDGDGNTDDDGDDAEDGDETDSGGDKDSSDDSDTNDSSDGEDSDNDGDDDADDHDGNDKSDTSDNDPTDDGSDGTPPFGRSAARYASLMARINAGENPLSWSGRPFDRSSVRRTAAGAGDDVVSDANVPNETQAADGLIGAPGPELPLSTKPRQLPQGGGSGMGLPGEDEGDFDPALNGGDIQAGQDAQLDAQREAKVRAIAADVHGCNPHLSAAQCRRVARQVVARYYKQAEDLSPLLYGDRGDVADGPFTQKVKNFQPPKPKGLGGGSSPAAESAGEEAAGAAGEAAGAAEGAEALAPLLLL